MSETSTGGRTFLIEKNWTRDGTPYLRVQDKANQQTFIFIVDLLDGTTYACPSTQGSNLHDFDGLRAACNHLKRNGYPIRLDGMQPAGFEF